MKRFFGSFTTAAPCLLLVLAGCGGGSGNPATHAVSGKVTYVDQPLADVAITFYPESGRNAVGKADKDGYFTMMTFEPNDGALAGTHKVTILPQGPPVSEATSASDYAPQKASKGPAPFPAKYHKPESTPLTVKIPDDLEGGTLNIKLLD